MSTPEPPDHVEWVPPPPTPERKGPKGSKWDKVAAELKANPMRWARLGEAMPTSIVSIIRKGDLRCFKPAGSFEAVTRNHTSRWVADVYARYVGEQPQQ